MITGRAMFSGPRTAQALALGDRRGRRPEGQAPCRLDDDLMFVSDSRCRSTCPGAIAGLPRKTPLSTAPPDPAPMAVRTLPAQSTCSGMSQGDHVGGCHSSRNNGGGHRALPQRLRMMRERASRLAPSFVKQILRITAAEHACSAAIALPSPALHQESTEHFDEVRAFERPSMTTRSAMRRKREMSIEPVMISANVASPSGCASCAVRPAECLQVRRCWPLSAVSAWMKLHAQWTPVRSGGTG
jgi:hypothetical protein